MSEQRRLSTTQAEMEARAIDAIRRGATPQAVEYAVRNWGSVEALHAMTGLNAHAIRVLAKRWGIRTKDPAVE